MVHFLTFVHYLQIPYIDASFKRESIPFSPWIQSRKLDYLGRYRSKYWKVQEKPGLFRNRLEPGCTSQENHR